MFLPMRQRVKKMLTFDIPRSAVVILDQLTTEGPMSPKQIATMSNIPARTVSFALRTLIKEKLCRKVPNLMDMRQPKYHVNDDRVKDCSAHLDRLRVELGVQLKRV